MNVDWDTLRSGPGAATIGPDRQPITASEARHLACDARIVPIVTGSKSEPLDTGQATRTILTGIRRSVANRYRGRTFPGCEKPAPYCQAHHAHEWRHGGDTTPDNLTHLSRQHHRLIHHSDRQIHMRHGRPEFTPPHHIDPLRRPRTNEVQHGFTAQTAG